MDRAEQLDPIEGLGSSLCDFTSWIMCQPTHYRLPQSSDPEQRLVK